MVRVGLAIFTAAVISGCTITEMKMAHDNPLDRIFDSGSFRYVLTAESSATNATLSWGSVFYTDGNGKVTELSTSEIQINGVAQLQYTATAPSQTDINTVKNKGALAYPTPPYTLPNAGPGSFTTTSAGFKGYYILRLDYKYDGKTGTLYSNFVAVQ